MIDVINNRFAGHLGTESLMAGVGIGNIYMNILFVSTIWGLNGAISTLVSQAYGAGNLKLCGVYLNRGRITVAIFFIPLSILLFLSEYTFLLLGFDHEASHYAGKFCKGMTVSLFFTTQFDCNRKFLMCCGY